MIIRPDKDPTWKVFKEPFCEKIYLKNSKEDSSLGDECAPEEADFINVTNHSYYCKDGVVICKREYFQIEDAKNPDFNREIETPYYDVISYISNKYTSILRCTECGAEPQLRIDKATGKFYCTCPSSFFGDDEEIGDKKDPEMPIGISENTRLYDTMVEAIDAWNDDNSYEFLKAKIEKLVREVNSYNEFSVRFDKIVFSGFIHYETNKIKKLLNLCNYFFNENAPEFEFFLYNDFEDYDTVKETYNNLIENLKKIIYFQYEYRIKNRKE